MVWGAAAAGSTSVASDSELIRSHNIQLGHINERGKMLLSKQVCLGDVC